MLDNKIVVTLIGNVGAGKSTAISLLSKKIKSTVLHVDDLFQTEDPFRDVFLADMSRWGLANELWLTLERAKRLKDHLKKSSKDVCFIDSGLLMSWVYAYSHFISKKITKHEWNLYERIYDSLTENLGQDSVVVIFLYSYTTLLKRIKKRGRDYEVRQYKKGYLESLQRGIDALEKKLRNDKIKIVKISEDKAPDFYGNKEDAEYLLSSVKKAIKR